MNPLSLFLTGSLLFILMSCGDHSGSSRNSQPGSCEEIDCLSTVNWKILLQGRSFPEKSRVDINGTTVLNECISKQKYTIERSTEPQSLRLDNFFVPKRGELKIDVIDLGPDCASSAVFISNDKLDFDVVKEAEGKEIVIHL